MKIFLDMVGCRLNQSELETFAWQFRQAGHTIVSEASQADLVVVNTCAVTAEAVSDSRQKIRRAARAGAGEVIATGCWSTLNPRDAAQLPKVSQVISNLEKEQLVADVLSLPAKEFDREPLARVPLPGLRQRTRAFIKVQDGCDNRCTFCITTLARGASRSRPIARVLADIHAALAGGTREIVLTGVHLGSWGRDFHPNLSLRDLIQAILTDTDVQRLRLSSLEPWDLDADFFSLWEDQRLCRHLHLPLQSGSSTILRRMARKVTPQSFSHVVTLARQVAPEIAITTDVIVGFPGEGEAELQESLEYVKSSQFAGGHVFSYSARPGTAAASFADQVPPAVRKRRSALMRAAFADASQEYQRKFLSTELEVLWESVDQTGPDGWQMHGLTGNYLHVISHARQPLWNEISCVRLVKISGGSILGTISSTA